MRELLSQPVTIQPQTPSLNPNPPVTQRPVAPIKPTPPPTLMQRIVNPIANALGNGPWFDACVPNLVVPSVVPGLPAAGCPGGGAR